jgi:outer membrane lipoprotein-sorting protein
MSCLLTIMAAVLPAASLQAQDARELLERVSAKYQQIESGRFEWVRTSETRTGASTSRNEFRYTVALARPDKVKVVIDYGHSVWVRVSDGKDLIRYRSTSGDVNKGPVPEDISRIVNSTRIGSYQNLTRGLQTAKLAGSETVRVGEAAIDCHVVEAQYEPRLAIDGAEPLPTRYWIDKERLVIVREVSASRSKETENTNTVTFTAVEIGGPLPEGEFVFARK